MSNVGFFKVCGPCDTHMHFHDLEDDTTLEILVEPGQRGCVSFMVGDAEKYGRAMFASDGTVTILFSYGGNIVNTGHIPRE